MKKVFLKFETGHGPRYSRTELKMFDGQLIRRMDEHFTVDLPRADWAASLARFGHGLLSDSQLRAVETMLGDLEHLDDSATLLEALRPEEAVP
jgi:hypothetical protein